MRSSLLVILFFNLLSFLPAQQGQTFLLRDAISKQPIQGAFFSYDTLQYGVTDENGEFDLDVRAEPLLLQVSHLAYLDTAVVVSPNTRGNTVITLQPASIVLPEITVGAGPERKFRRPEDLIKRALRAIPKNYVTTSVHTSGYYRESIVHDDCLVSAAEAVLEYRLSPYGSKHAHRKAWAQAWDRRYASYPHQFNGRVGLLSFDHASGIQQYAAVEDVYRPVRTRYSTLVPPLSRYSIFTDGPLDMIALDKVRLGYDFLSRSNLKDHIFTLVDSVFVNNVFCYQIHFRPADDEPTEYLGLNKEANVAFFSGDLYLSIDQLAIVRYEAWNSKNVIRNFSPTAGRIAPINSLKIRVDYAMDKNKRWALSYVHSRVTSPTNPRFSAVRALYLTEGQSETSLQTKRRWYGFNFLNHLHNLGDDHDPQFWTAFESSSLYQTLHKLDPISCDGKDKGLTFAREEKREIVNVPQATPKGNLRYVNSGQRRKDWAWLESPTDSATLTYLRWENDYYDQYFRSHRSSLDVSAEQFSSTAQGLSFDATTTVYPDTVFRRIGGTLGFFIVGAQAETELIVSAPEVPNGYVIADYGWNHRGRYFYTVSENLAYDRILSICPQRGVAAQRQHVDEYVWHNDTLYLTTSNELLRTNGFFRWVENEGFTTILTEERPDFEFRLQEMMNGEVMLITESLRDAEIYRKRAGKWSADGQQLPSLLAGTGPEGRGCEAMVAADYLIDCRTMGDQSALIAARDGRQMLFIQRGQSAEWSALDLPPGISVLRFSDGIPGEIGLDLEGVGSYGQRATINFKARQLTLIPTAYPPIELEGYVDSIVMVTADDGTKIPCQMRWRKDQEGQLKSTLLKVYGAYGNPYFIGHSETDIALMNLGMAVVYVHVRGGGVRGPEWYDAGRAEHKLRACTDYLAALRYFTTRHPLGQTLLTGYAQSAGGPILGYAVNEYPELLIAAVFDHAFLDVVGVMQRPELPLTRYEYAEWGDPSRKDIRQLQARYSPHQNIKQQAYPALLFLAGLHDQSTPYWQIGKFVAALRATNDGAPRTILRTNLRGSHPGTPFGPTQAQRYEQIAFLLAESERWGGGGD